MSTQVRPARMSLWRYSVRRYLTRLHPNTPDRIMSPCGSLCEAFVNSTDSEYNGYFCSRNPFYRWPAASIMSISILPRGKSHFSLATFGRTWVVKWLSSIRAITFLLRLILLALRWLLARHMLHLTLFKCSGTESFSSSWTPHPSKRVSPSVAVHVIASLVSRSLILLLLFREPLRIFRFTYLKLLWLSCDHLVFTGLVLWWIRSQLAHMDPTEVLIRERQKSDTVKTSDVVENHKGSNNNRTSLNKYVQSRAHRNGNMTNELCTGGELWMKRKQASLQSIK